MKCREDHNCGLDVPKGHPKEAQHTPTYGVEEVTWLEGIALGLRFAVRTIDPLSGVINGGSTTLTYCCTREQAEIIVRAVNSYEELSEIKNLLLKAKERFDQGLPMEYSELVQKAIAQAEGRWS